MGGERISPSSCEGRPGVGFGGFVVVVVADDDDDGGCVGGCEDVDGAVAAGPGV